MPFKTDGSREYRSYSVAFSVPEDEEYMVEGYATTFDAPYDFGIDGTKERILRSALDGADMSDVIFQLNHDGQTMARLRNGSLVIELDEHGMRVRAYLGGSRSGRDLYEAIKSGLIDRMSWGFAVPTGGYEYDEATRTFTVTRVSKVFDVSAVSIPANEDTEIHARSYIDGAIDAGRQELARRERARRALALKAKAASIRQKG